MVSESKKDRWKEERETRRAQLEQDERRRKLKHAAIWCGVLVIAVIIAVVIYKKVTGPGAYDSLAQCMTENGMTMYGTNWCPHCQRQKQLFGRSFKYIHFVDCDIGTACEDANVQAYPTWAKDSTLFPSGVKSLAELATLSGCRLP